MSALSSALAAMDKATPGPWEWDAEMDSFDLELEAPWLWGKSMNIPVLKYVCEHMKVEDATIIAAAPDALAWIKEALPWLERMREGMEAPLMVEPEKYDALCALIARAKPEEAMK